MKTYSLFKEYIWLVNTIARAGKITLEEINEKWLETDMSEGMPLMRRTFIRHKAAIEEMFGIYIDVERRNGYRYFIGNANVLHDDTIQNWMLSTLTVNSIIGDGVSLQDRIVIESMPLANDHLGAIISAMKKHKCIQIEYLKYGSSVAKEVVLEPYCLKMFKQRWYVIGHFSDGALKTYSLDRIKTVKLLSQRFEVDPDFKSSELFDEYFGILRMESVPCERVVLRAFGKERYYLRDLPLHHTQKVVEECAEYADFQLNLRPTSDFVTHLLSRGAQLKVMRPQWLADELKEMAANILNMYK